MKAKCPKCGFEGNISDHLIPDNGRNINCPKCKESFFIRKEVPPVIERKVIQQPSPPITISPRTYIPSRQDRDTKTLFLKIVSLLVISGVVFVMGFFAGIQYHKNKYSINEKDTAKIETPPDKPEATKPVVPQPTPPPIPEIKPETPQPNWEEMTSDTYTDITQVDTRTLQWEDSDLTDLQKDDEIRKYGEVFLGTNLKGYLKVTDVRSAHYNNLLFPGLDDSFPDQTYKYVIEAVNLYPLTKWDHQKNKVMLGVKGSEDFLRSLSKDTGIYAEGYIYAWKWSISSYELYLVNCSVNLAQ